MINFDNILIKMLIEIIEKDSFDIKEQKFTFKEYSNILNIFIELIISYLSEENNKTIPDGKIITSINNIITKIFIPIFKNENESLFNTSHKEMIFRIILEKLFVFKNIKLIIFLNPIKELLNNFYELFMALIKSNKKESNTKLHELINKIINENVKISIYLYKILYELILLEDNDDQIGNNTTESFMVLYYKSHQESKENLKEIYKIFVYLIKEKKILFKKNQLKDEIQIQLCDLNIQYLFDNSFEILVLLIKELQKADEIYSDKFNIEEILKLYTYCFKEKDKNLIKEKLIKLIKLIFEIMEILDNYIYNRAKLLLGYPTFVFQKNKDNYESLFGVNIMNNTIETEIYKYINYNHIKKERCVFGLLFPSSHEKKEENYLDENDRNDLIYDLISRILGINVDNEGNYFLFKYIYLMQTRSIKYENLYLEMKEILDKANQNNNNKYNLDKINELEKYCIDLINYETSEALNRISNEEIKQKKESKPQLPETITSNQSFQKEEKIYQDFIGYISNIIPHETGKIEIKIAASNKSMKIIKFEYFTTFYTKKELLSLEEQKKQFSYEFVANERNDEKNNDNNFENNDGDVVLNLSDFIECKNEKNFIDKINNSLNENNMVILANKELLNAKKIKSTLIRYYILSNKKTLIKIELKEGENIDKDIQNNYCLPRQIHDFSGENEFKNIFNIYRIKKEFNFMKDESVRFNFKTKNAEKYFKDFLE